MYIKSNKIIAPGLIWIIFLYFNYMSKPISYVPDLSFSGMILYLIMIWIGFTYMDMEDIITEQLIILKIKSATRYNISKVLFIIIISISMSIIGILVPVTQHIINNYSLFNRNLLTGDIIYGFILLNAFALLGAALGTLFHPRIVKDRKIAVVIVFLIGILGYIKGVLIEDFPVLRFILWAFPPVFDILAKFTELEYFNLNNIMNSLLLAAAYSLVLFFLQVYILGKKMF